MARKKKAPVKKVATIEERIEALKGQQAQAEQHVANFSVTATKCAGAIEALTAVLNDQKKK